MWCGHVNPTVFRPKYSVLTWALLAMYTAPWLVAVCFAATGSYYVLDWRIFWLFSSTVWLCAGLLHLKTALLRRVILDGGDVTVEMALQKPVTQQAEDPVLVVADVVLFERQAVYLRYLANGSELMQLLVEAAGQGNLNLIYEERDDRPPWTVEKTLLCLIVFAVYMMAALKLKIRPFDLIGPATDAMLLGWAAMLPVLLIVKITQVIKVRLRNEAYEDYEREPEGGLAPPPESAPLRTGRQEPEPEYTPRRNPRPEPLLNPVAAARAEFARSPMPEHSEEPRFYREPESRPEPAPQKRPEPKLEHKPEPKPEPEPSLRPATPGRPAPAGNTAPARSARPVSSRQTTRLSRSRSRSR